MEGLIIKIKYQPTRREIIRTREFRLTLFTFFYDLKFIPWRIKCELYTRRVNYVQIVVDQALCIDHLAGLVGNKLFWNNYFMTVIPFSM